MSGVEVDPVVKMRFYWKEQNIKQVEKHQAKVVTKNRQDSGNK